MTLIPAGFDSFKKLPRSLRNEKLWLAGYVVPWPGVNEYTTVNYCCIINEHNRQVRSTWYLVWAKVLGHFMPPAALGTCVPFEAMNAGKEL